MSTKGWVLVGAGLAVYALIGWGVFELLQQVSGSADMPLWKERLWAATWPLIPLYLLLGWP